MVPNGWSVVKLGDVLTLGSGDTKPTDLQKEFSDDSPYPVYGGNNIMGYSSQKNSSDSVILIGRVGEYCGVTRYIDKACWITDNALYTKSVSSDIDKEYLVSKLKKFDLSRLRNKGGQPLVSQKPIYAVKLPMPPLPEQRKIAKILSTWDKAISTTEKLIETSKQQKKALMQQLLTGKKRLVNPETGKAFEGEWEEVKLNQIAHITMGSSPKSESYNENGKGLPLLQGNADIKSRKSAPRIHTSQITKECEIGDILLSVRAPVGSVAKSLHNACIGRGIAGIQAKRNVAQEFLYQWLLAFEPKWERFSQGSTFEAVNSNDIKTLHISAPSYLEQQKIASVLTAADKEIEVLEGKLAHFKQEKKALMQQLLTGKKRVVI
jgi:type I restriction enzyme S subunit